MKMNTLRVSSKSYPNSVAGAIVATLRERDYVRVQTIGAGAVNQAIKAIAIARGFVAPMGIDLVCTPAFTDVQINGEDRSGIDLIVEKRTK